MLKILSSIMMIALLISCVGRGGEASEEGGSVSFLFREGMDMENVSLILSSGDKERRAEARYVGPVLESGMLPEGEWTWVLSVDGSERDRGTVMIGRGTRLEIELTHIH